MRWKKFSSPETIFKEVNFLFEFLDNRTTGLEYNTVK